jgi:hypothetical protein
MTLQNENTKPQTGTAAAGKRMLIGAAIGLVLISIFLSGVDNPNPAWPQLWMLRPLIVVPVAGAMGGLFTYYISRLRLQNGVVKLLVFLLSIAGFIVALWLGVVLGLEGTLWD